MAELDKLMESGTKLGLSGEDLLSFVKSEREREEKLEKDRCEREEKLEKDRYEREERERQREEKLEKDRFEREERNREREIRKLELEKEIEIERVRAGAASSTRVSTGHETRAKLPKLPNFNEKLDNIDAYLRRFERFAESAGWDRRHWATHLSALLTGTALDVYSRLPVDDAVKYEKLKENLLKRFHLTEEGFRDKFRQSKLESGETAAQFVIRLGDYLHHWMDQAKVPLDYNGLRDLVLREQFLQSSGKGLQLFLKERKFSSVTEMAESADRYVEAHGVYNSGVGTGRLRNNVQSENRRMTETFRGKSCFNCSGPHLMKDCPRRREKAAGLFQPKGKFGSDQNQSGGYRTHGSFNRNGTASAVREGYPRQDNGKVFSRKCLDSGKKNLSACCLSDDKVILNCGHELPVMSVACNDQRPNNMPEHVGTVEGKTATVLRDTGCSTVVVKKSLVDAEMFTGETQMCVLIDGTVRKFPTAVIQVSSPFFTGEVMAMCMEAPVYDLIIGNIDGVKDVATISLDNKNKAREDEIKDKSRSVNTGTADETQDEQRVSDIEEEDLQQSHAEAAAIQTRAQAKKEQNAKAKPMKVPQAVDIENLGPDSLIKAQNEDATLEGARELAGTGEVKLSGKLNTYRYFRKNGIVFREYSSPKHMNGQGIKQLVVPREYRQAILKVAHESLLGGHLGTQKTADKILAQFHWPGILADVKRHCASCDICQRTISKGKVKKVPLEQMPLIEVPFQRVAVDLVGPIAPASERGYRYILTVVDYATRYPEAMPLKNIETETVAEALMDIFTRVGVPREILSDQGTQFTSGLMKEVSRLLSLKQLITTPYHAQCNGLVEKFNGTLKSIIKKLCVERPRDWDKFIAPALFAYREAPQASTGFSPFELLYGRTVRGPMLIMKGLMTKDLDETEVKTVYQYVVDLRERLEDTLKLAKEELKKSQVRYKKNFDQRAKARTLQPGDKALVLLPTNANKLLMQWRGPFEVIQRLGEVDYKLRVQGKEKVYHANMIKKYMERADAQTGNQVFCALKTTETDFEFPEHGADETGIFYHIGAAVIEEVMEAKAEEHKILSDLQRHETSIEFPKTNRSETENDVKVGPKLSKDQREMLEHMLKEYQDILTDVPGKTMLVEHAIKTTSDIPVRSKPYPVPYAVKQAIDQEVQSMLEMDIIEPSDAAYSSPVVVVRKPDGTNRFCVDYRKVNSITEFDAEPMPNQEEIFAKLNNCCYFSRIDLSKGYWQIPVAEDSKKYTSFATHKGLWQFKRMPFGLATAPGNFSRMMRKLLKGLEGVDNFQDDILIFSKTFEEHIHLIKEVLNRLLRAALTARPTKCMLAFDQLDFLGHKVCEGQIEPNPEKVEAILKAKRPATKTEVRSFLGMASYYRKFIPNFAAKALPLTGLTKKGQPNKVRWNSEHERGFKGLKESLTNAPVLRMPNLEKPFILRTDASKEGLGAVLLQETEEGKFPVAYASRKLLSREVNYSVVEKECLAVIWGVQKFHTFLYGKHFLLETDHMPLVYLNKAKESNGHLMRWALKLQSYRFTVVAIKGSDNVGADYLSRSKFD